MSSRCPGCSAAVRPGDRWCGLCLRVLTPADDTAGSAAAPRLPEPRTAEQAVPAARTAEQAVPAARTAEQVVPSPAVPVPRVRVPAGDRPRTAHWPCPGCGAEVPVALDRCPGCSTGFLAPLRGGAASAGLAATLQQQSQARRLLLGVLAGVLASLLLVGVVALLSLLL